MRNIQFFGILHHIEKYIYGSQIVICHRRPSSYVWLACTLYNLLHKFSQEIITNYSSFHQTTICIRAKYSSILFFRRDCCINSILNSSSCAIFVWVLLRLVRWFLYAIQVVVDILQNIQVHCPNVLESEQLFYVYVVKFIDFAWLNSIYLVSESSE